VGISGIYGIRQLEVGRMMSGSADGSIKIGDLITNECNKTTIEHNKAVSSNSST